MAKGKDNILTRNEREALVISYKQFANSDEVPEFMDLHAPNGEWVARLCLDKIKEYPLNSEGVHISTDKYGVYVEYRYLKKGYVYWYDRNYYKRLEREV